MANPIPITFPLGGVSEQAAYAGEPAPNIVRPDHCLNVRPYDSIERRRRGGKRTGVSRFFAERANSLAVRFLGTAIEAVALSEEAGFGSKYANPSSLVDREGREVAFHPDGDRVALRKQAHSSSNSTIVFVYEFNAATGFGDRQDAPDTHRSGSDRSLRWRPQGDFLMAGAWSTTAGRTIIYPYDKDTGLGTPFIHGPGSNNRYDGPRAWHPDGDVFAVATSIGDGSSTDRHYVEVWEFDPGSGVGSMIDKAQVADGGGTSLVDDLAFSPDGAHLLIGSSASTTTMRIAALPFNKATGFGSLLTPSTAPSAAVRAVAWHPSGSVVVANTVGSFANAYEFSTGFGSRIVSPNLSGKGSGTGIRGWIGFNAAGDLIGLSNSSGTNNLGVISWDGGFGADAITAPPSLPGDTINPGDWSPSGEQIGFGLESSPRIIAWGFEPGTLNPSARKTRVVSVQDGSVYRSNHPPTVLSLVNSGADAFNSFVPVRGVAAFQKMFFVDGESDNYAYLDFADNTLKDWSADLSAGALPAGTDDTDLGATIMVLYRGRVVLSGLREEPQNWFMSRSGDPFDFDYSPAETSPIQAVAGNASNAGELGDVVTALAPHQDDILIMGGASSLWMMRGDPAAGGQIDNISRQTGIVGPDAWTWDASNVLWFFGPNGLYRLAPGSIEPELVSRGKLDRTFTELDTSASDVRLIYDRQWQGVHMFVTPVNEPDDPVDHWFFDERTGGFWRDRYPTAFGPTAVHLFQGDTAENRAVLLGGFDGRIRHFDPQATDDDGAAMTSFVRFPIIHPGLPMGQFQLSEMQVHTDEASNGLTLEMYRGHTPQEAAEADTPAFTRALAGGRNLPIRKRLRANALQVRLVHDASGATWAYENGSMMVAGVGRQRARL